MQISGLTQDELFILSRNIGNQDSGHKAQNKPVEVAKLLDKALTSGISEDDLAKLLNLEATTMFYRHKYIFNNLIKELHDKVIYGSSDFKKNREKEGYITFQQANELSRIKKEFQKKVYDFIIEKHIKGWNDIKSIKELLEINGYKNFEDVLNRIIERKGLDNKFRVGNQLDLMNLNKKLFKKTQAERDKIFFKICESVFSDKLHNVTLGYKFYEIVFKNNKISIGQNEIDSNKKILIQKIKDLE